MPNTFPQPVLSNTIFKQIVLERLRVASRQSVARSVLEAAHLDSYVDPITRELVLSLESYVLAEELENHTRTVKLEATFNHPATWWQMFKRDHFPSWLLDRFPVMSETERQTKQTTVTFKKYATYPRSTISVKELGQPVYRVYMSEDEADAH